MRKQTAETRPAEVPEGPGDAAEATSDDAPAFDPAHQWPSEGGCYVRQTDGSLTRED
ncbi:hypothetical protein [Sphingomonas sp.]|jgi:hypothetical protein|uniref:hypothetical protein n=1 Tax=Sphingomonas sp. TaxID=28214 RepID=UPI002ED9D15A